MCNLKSDWNFSATSLDLATKDDQFALRICAIDLKNEPLAAEVLIKIKTCLAGAKISVEVADIKIEPIRDGAKTTLQNIFVVAKLIPKAPKMQGPAFSFLKLLSNWCAAAHLEPTDTFLTWTRLAESRRKVPTGRAQRWRSSRSTAQRSFRWRSSARRCA